MHEEIKSGESPEDEARAAERLNALGLSLSKTRDEAIEARQTSGIEDIWREDEEYYEGLDEENSGRGDANTKPPGRITTKGRDSRSTVFLNITRPYVEAAAAKVSDILLPTDERSWGISTTPIPEMEQTAEGQLPEETVDGMQQLGVDPAAQQQVAQVEAQAAQKTLAEARDKAEKAQTRIEDWHVEGQWHAEVRKVIFDTAKIGSGVLKGPVPVNRRAQMFKDGALVTVDEIKPVSKRISPWNFYPDGACGESIHNGNYTWERDFITPKKLREMKRDPDYITSQIDECLREGPKKATINRKTADGKELNDKDLFEIWYGHVQVSREDMEAAGCDCPEGDTSSFPGLLTMVNDRVIKAALNPLDTGEFPYDVIPWQRRANMPWGYGVGRLVRTPQAMLLAANRVMLTNAGRSAGPIFISKAGAVTPADGDPDIAPWKQFYLNAEEVGSVRDAMMMFEIPDRQAALMNIINFALKMAEDVTGLPMLLQGQTGAAPETLGGQQLADRNASSVLKNIARTFDDCITEPHVRRYYAWLLQYGEDDEKGDFVIDARGSTALVERDIYRQEIAVMLQASLNPAFGLDPEKCMAESLRVSRKVPEKFQLTDQQKQERAKAQQEPPPDPRVMASKEVAQIRSKSEVDKATINAQTDMQELQFKADEAEKQRMHEARMQERAERIEMMKLASAQNISLGEIKATLAGTALKLRTQKELSREGRAAEVMKPPTEPRGRAPNGQSFAK